MTHDSMIEVIAAHRDGKEIEFRLARMLDEIHNWKRWGNGERFSFDLHDFRIKPAPPKPREFWINCYLQSEPVICASESQANEADKYCGRERFELIHVREVLHSTGEEEPADHSISGGARLISVVTDGGDHSKYLHCPVCDEPLIYATTTDIHMKKGDQIGFDIAKDTQPH